MPRRGEPEPWWSTTIHAWPLRSSLATKTLKPAWGSSLPANVPIGPNAGMLVRAKWRKARGFEPCSWPKAQPYLGSRGGCQVAQVRAPFSTAWRSWTHFAHTGGPSGAFGWVGSIGSGTAWAAAGASIVPRRARTTTFMNRGRLGTDRDPAA